MSNIINEKKVRLGLRDAQWKRFSRTHTVFERFFREAAAISDESRSANVHKSINYKYLLFFEKIYSIQRYSWVDSVKSIDFGALLFR